MLQFQIRTNSRNNSLLNSFAQFGFRDFLHLPEDHGGNLLRAEDFLITQVVHLDVWRTILANDGERPVGHILFVGLSVKKLKLLGRFKYLLDFGIAENVR